MTFENNQSLTERVVMQPEALHSRRREGAGFGYAYLLYGL
jgi:hypothetical protein